MIEKPWPKVRPDARWRVGSVAAVLLCFVAGCAQDPTEVVVTVFSDLPCDTSSVAAVVIGTPGELGDRPLSGTSTTCDPDGSRGDVVLVPKGSKDAEFALEVRISADPAAVSIDDCVAANDYQNCIVARRILSFIPERTVHLRVDLRNPCVSTSCSQLTSCVAQGTSKSCINAQIDVSKCVGECNESTVIAQHPDSGASSDACANDCDPHATCTNGDGGFSCVCNEGYSGADGTTCQQVACSVQCSAQGACVKDDKGQFACQCNAGFVGDGVACSDVDECAATVSPCAAKAACTNSVGSFSCKCLAGYTGDGQTCTDVDECAKKTANCPTGTECVNTPGSFDCSSCAAGYTGDGTTCTDIDECADQTANCDPIATCVNLPGSFSCNCPMGYTNVAGTCTDIDECTASTPCSAGETCTNTPGSYTCQCTSPVNQVPVMSSNTTPSGVASSSGDYPTTPPDQTYPAWQAFDGAPTLWLSKPGVTSAWLGYEFASGTPTIIAYEIYFANGMLTNRGPRDWTFEGSNVADDTGWVTLDLRAGITWTTSNTQRFAVATPGAYRKYRLNVSHDNANSSTPIDVLSIGELRLLSCGM